MNAAQATSYAWQHADWPYWRIDGALAGALARAWRMQGVAQGKMESIGMPHGAQADLIHESWAQEAVATAAIEGVRISLGSGPNVWLYGLSRHFCEHRSSYYEALGRAQGPSMRAWLAAHRTGWLAK